MPDPTDYRDDHVAPEEPAVYAPGERARSSATRFPVFRQLGLLAGLLALIFGGAALPKLIGGESQPSAPTVADTRIEELPPPVSALAPLGDVRIGATAAFVYDVRAERALYEKNADTILPLASITKLMTTLIAYELVAEDETVSVDAAAIRQEGNSGFAPGESFSLVDLADLALVSSSNDAAFALASAAGALLSDGDPTATFVAGMNIRAEELGLDSLDFKNPTGLDVSATEAGAYGSAREVSLLMAYILTHHPEILDATQLDHDRLYNTAGAYHDVENTNVIVSEIPNLIGSKTGYTDLAGGNLTVAFDAGLNRPIIVTVLGSSYAGRFEDVLTLVEAVRATTRTVTP